MALLLSRSDVQKLLPMSKAIDVVEGAFSELARGTAEMPDRTVITDDEVGGWIAFMPAYLGSSGALGVKAVTVYKANPEKHNLPTTLATIIVQDQQTGQTVAVMDGGYLTAVRTGAVSGVATRHLARANASVAGILGTGVQARTQVTGMAAAKSSAVPPVGFATRAESRPYAMVWAYMSAKPSSSRSWTRACLKASISLVMGPSSVSMARTVLMRLRIFRASLASSTESFFEVLILSR